MKLMEGVTGFAQKVFRRGKVLKTMTSCGFSLTSKGEGKSIYNYNVVKKKDVSFIS